MASAPAIFLLSLLLIIPINGIDLSDNGTSPETQSPRANRRVVRLYSGTRPKPILCLGEGFQADSEDCTVFHRCMKNGNGRFLSFRFQCGPGTIYDPETEICNHPERTKRTGCGANKPIFVPNIEFSLDNDISREIPSPISTKQPTSSQTTTHLSFSTFKTPNGIDLQSTLSTSGQWVSAMKTQDTTKIVPPTKRQVIETSTISTTPSWMSSQKSRVTTTRRNIRQTTSQSGDVCTSEGFMGDSENCRKFYRCISNQRGGFIRYEFSCTESTVWDDDAQSCNHAWSVKRRRCGRGSIRDNNDFIVTSTENKVSTVDDISIATSKPIQSQLQINYASKVIQTQSQISSGSVIQNQTQINYAQNNTKASNVLQNQTQITHGSAISQTQTQINYGDKAVQTQLQIDHSKESSQTQTQMSESTSTHRTTQYHLTQVTPISTTNNKCAESGFMGDSEDCKRFYRCVDNGMGGFIRYEFSCGEGTVWDANIEACNHAWAVKECGGKAPSESSSQSTIKATESSSKPTVSLGLSTTTSTQSYYSSTEEEIDEDNDISYGNQPISVPPSEPPQETTGTKAPAISNNSNYCKTSGFMGDNTDCKKFYRCVDNGNGDFTRYEFSCGEGTVWDQTIEACNHAWAVKNCGGSTSTSSSTGQTQTISTQTSTQRPPLNDDNNTGYGSQNDESPSETTIFTTTTIKSSPSSTSQSLQLTTSSSGNDCISSGFMGDKNDCKKFYRCVDNGNNGYTRYEFTCGEGTVWDPKIEACNHAWAVEKCGGNLAGDISNVETTTRKNESTNAFITSSTTQIIEPDDNNDVGYGQQNNEPQQITSTSNRPQYQDNDRNECKSSGFMGDINDCKKFYRCVDNGDGTFIRYEFSCGEGTVWDSQIDACNHAWAVKDQCADSGQGESNNVQSTTLQSSIHEGIETDDEGPNKPTTQKTSTSTSYTLKPSDNQCTQDGFYGNKNNCKKFYRCVNDGQGGFNKFEFTCGEGTVWSQDIQACDHESSDKKCLTHSTSAPPSNVNDEMLPESTTKHSESLTTNSGYDYTFPKPQSSKDKCQNEGFYGDSTDCKKFYRCVDDGKGGFTKYDFTCGDGTVWDQEILSCNHETIKCSINSENTPLTSSTILTDSMESSTVSQEQQVTREPDVTNSNSNNQCKSEGFFSNSMDCRKFYRCVSNGKGGYTKYDFSCGEGTVWVQEIQACDYDNDVSSCSSQNNTTNPDTIEQQQSTSSPSTTTSQYPTQAQPSDKEQDEYPSSSTSKPQTESEECTSEGFHGNKNDCKQFYRCVDNGRGGYTKYDFTCGEGTAWDSNIQTCNHISEVHSCQNTNEQTQSKPNNDEESLQSSETTSSNKDSSTESTKPTKTDKCDQEGYFGNTNDCTMFYRCVDNGKGGFSKYDFTCGEGTIWDQDLTTCNHPQDVVNPSCDSNDKNQSSSESSSSTESSGTTSSSSITTTQNSESSQSSTEGNSQISSNCSQESSSKKPSNQKVKCEKAGYYPDPNDCKKFYRCVDWDGDGQKFSVYHFDCGEGTIWDPQLETCNHEESVYPPRDCSGTQSENVSSETTTTEKSTTSQENSTSESITTQTNAEETTTQQLSSSEQTTQTTEKTTTTQQSSTEQTTKPSTTEKTTTQQTTSSEMTTQNSTSEQTTTEQTTTSQGQTTKESTTSQQTTEQSTTTEQTTTQQTTASEQTTQQSSSSEQTTQQSSTTEQTTQQSSSSEQTTPQPFTDDTTTESATTEPQASTTEQSTTTTEKSNEQSTMEQTATENTTEKETTTTESSTTSESSEGTTTENNQGTTTQETTTSEKECPETDDDQYLYVCPTSFRRHPKYCNMFYQCTEDDNSHEVKIATFKCPNNTIYDESKTQCVEENKADKKCNGQIARKYRVKRLNSNYKEPIEVSDNKHTCSSVGYYPFEKDECSGAFLKCQKTKYGKLRGYVHRCPAGYTYWSISKRCEKEEYMKDCKRSANTWKDRWEIPLEKKNIAK